MRRCSSTHSQRGVAALSVTTLLLFAMLLVVAVANRNVVVESRASANQLRSTQAFEAAEAGLEWSLAKLNDDTAIGDDCLPSDAAGATSFRERMLSYDAALPGFRPSTWLDGGIVRPLQVACRHDDTGWSCGCPTGGLPVLPVTVGNPVTPVFAIAFSPGAKAGIVITTAAGCTQSDAACFDATATGHEATARIEVAFGLLPGLRASPLAALTARGNVDTVAALGVREAASTPVSTAIHAGGHVEASALRLDTPAESSLASGDATLSALSLTGSSRAGSRQTRRAGQRSLPSSTCAAAPTATAPQRSAQQSPPATGCSRSRATRRCTVRQRSAAPTSLSSSSSTARCVSRATSP